MALLTDISDELWRSLPSEEAFALFRAANKHIENVFYEYLDGALKYISDDVFIGDGLGLLAALDNAHERRDARVEQLIRNKYRAATLFGEDPTEIWGEIHFSDSTMLLVLVMVLTATHVFLPIRWAVVWVLDIWAVFGCMALSLFL